LPLAKIPCTEKRAVSSSSGHWENPAKLTYAASGDIVLRLKTNTDFFVPRDLDQL